MHTGLGKSEARQSREGIFNWKETNISLAGAQPLPDCLSEFSARARVFFLSLSSPLHYDGILVPR